MRDLMWDLMCTNVSCVNVLPCGRASVSVYAFDHVWLFVCTCVSAYVCFPAHVLTSGRVCLCVLRVQVPVCMFMRAHVCCPLTDYLYPRCDIYSRLSRRVQAGPRETWRELNVFFFFFSGNSVCSNVGSAAWTRTGSSYFLLKLLLALPGKTFSNPEQYSLGEGLDLLGYYSASSFMSLLSKKYTLPQHTQKKNAYWITPSRSAALFLLFFSGMHLGFVGSACSINLFSKPELLMQTDKTFMIFFLGSSRLIRLQCPSNDTHICT